MKRLALKNKKIIVFVSILLIVILGLYFGIKFAKNSKISGIWKSPDDSSQYKFTIYGKFNFASDPSDLHCDLWTCNFENGNYELKTENGKKIMIQHLGGVGTYTAEYEIKTINNQDILEFRDDSHLSTYIKIGN